MNSEKYQEHQVVDFDLHGLAGIRLIDPSKSDARAVKRQLGTLSNGLLDREPDIVIRFKKNLSLPHLTYLGRDENAFTTDGFFVLKSKKSSAKVKIPFESIGSHCEIECETGLPAVPYLIPIINLTLLKNDCIPLHASAFVYKGRGILVTGWSKGGKTEALLGFVSKGARYVGDEWVILTKNGRSMHGIPEPITLWDWQIEQLPSLAPRISASDYMVFKLVHVMRYIHSYLGKGKLKDSFPAKILNKAMPTLLHQLHVNIPPEKIMTDRSIQLNARPDIIFFIMSHNSPSIRIEPWGSEDIAKRMIHSLQYEQRRFISCYEAFKFAFPDLKNNFLERVPETQKILLQNALKGKAAYRVLHPYPVSLEALYRHMKPFCEGKIK